MSKYNDLMGDSYKATVEARQLNEQAHAEKDESRKADLFEQSKRALDHSISLEKQATEYKAIEDREAAFNAADERRDSAVRSYSLTDTADAETRAFERYLSHGETRAMGTSETGALISASYADKIVESLKSFGGVMSVATVFTTPTGGIWNQPTFDNTTGKARRIAQNTQVNDKDMSFGNKTLSAYTYTTDAVRVGREALQDAGFDFEGVIFSALNDQWGRGINEELTTGTGSSMPQGVHYAVANNANAVITSTFANNAVSADELFALQHEVNSAYRPNASWMFNDNTLLKIRTLKDTTGAYIWQPGLTADAPALVLGKRYTINDDMPNIGASVTPILFGDFSKYYVRIVKDMTVLRLIERYADYHQVGFIGHARADGALMDARAIKGLKIKA